MLSEQGILNESAVPSGISDPAVAPAIDQPQVPATNVAVSSLPQFYRNLKLCPWENFLKMLPEGAILWVRKTPVLGHL